MTTSANVQAAMNNVDAANTHFASISGAIVECNDTGKKVSNMLLSWFDDAHEQLKAAQVALSLVHGAHMKALDKASCRV